MSTSYSAILYPWLLMALITFSSECAPVQDFSYAQYQIVDRVNKQTDLSIHPQRSILDHYQFPQACSIDHFLNISFSQEESNLKISNVDQEINYLKDNIGRFLRLSSQVELLKQTLQNLPPYKDAAELILPEEDFKGLQLREDALRALNKQIDSKGVELQRQVKSLMKQNQNPIFQEGALKFQQRALSRKINLLTELKNTQPISTKNQDLISNYFNELQQIFENQTDLIHTIQTLLQTHNQLVVLKATVTNLLSQIKALNLSISEKEQCSKEFQRIQQKQKHDQEVVKLIQLLKVKKTQFNQPSKYCEGVVVKLVSRVKKLLGTYDYVFQCKEGLPELLQERQVLQNKLNEAQRKLDTEQMSQEVNQFKNVFETNRALIQGKMEQVKQLQLDPIHLDQVDLELLIQISKKRLGQITTELENLPQEQTHSNQENHRNIKLLVKQIKALKAQHCRQSQKYTELVEKVQEKLNKLQHQEDYNEWLHKVEHETMEEMVGKMKEMAEIQIEIERHMQGEL